MQSMHHSENVLTEKKTKEKKASEPTKRKADLFSNIRARCN